MKRASKALLATHLRVHRSLPRWCKRELHQHCSPTAATASCEFRISFDEPWLTVSRLITFNNSNPAPPKIKRQASAPQVYNVTQNFAAVAGTSYQLSAYAAQAQNGATPPACSIQICGDTTCGASTALTAQYSPYTYQYNAGVTNAGAVATFSVSCPQSAYVALDNVTVVAGTAAAASLTPITTTVIQYVTRTQSIQGATQTETTRQIGTPSTQIYSVTNTVSTVLWSTATVVTSVPQTEFLNVTVSELSTTTSEPSHPW